jgi:hypothetical protein
MSTTLFLDDSSELLLQCHYANSGYYLQLICRQALFLPALDNNYFAKLPSAQATLSQPMRLPEFEVYS